MHSTSAAIPVGTLPAAATFARRGCHQITPYRAGFEDALYDCEYRNPYRAGSAAYAEYEQGVQDGNQRRVERWL